MIKLGWIKGGIQLLTGIGVTTLVDEALNMVKPKDLTGIKKVAVKVGAFAVSWMAADKVTEYVEEVWDTQEQKIRDFVTPPEVVTEVEIEAE